MKLEFEYEVGRHQPGNHWLTLKDGSTVHLRGGEESAQAHVQTSEWADTVYEFSSVEVRVTGSGTLGQDPYTSTGVGTAEGRFELPKVHFLPVGWSDEGYYRIEPMRVTFKNGAALHARGYLDLHRVPGIPPYSTPQTFPPTTEQGWKDLERLFRVEGSWKLTEGEFTGGGPLVGELKLKVPPGSTAASLDDLVLLLRLRGEVS